MRRTGLAAIGILLLVVVEIALFVLVAHVIGWGWAVLIGVATMIVGGVLLKREGVRGWRRFRTAITEGRPPGAEVSNGVVGLVAALLVLTPGFLTDAVGLLLLLPPARALVRSRVRRFAERRISPGVAGDLFGPRFVKATRGATQPPATTSPPPALTGEVVEGEIIDPRQP